MACNSSSQSRNNSRRPASSISCAGARQGHLCRRGTRKYRCSNGAPPFWRPVAPAFCRRELKTRATGRLKAGAPFLVLRPLLFLALQRLIGIALIALGFAPLAFGFSRL